MDHVFLEVGDPAGGIVRYGRVLAEALQRNGAACRTRGVSLTDTDILPAVRAALRARRGLRNSDLLVIPFSRYHWSPNAKVRLAQALTIHLGRGRRNAVIFHDVYPDEYRAGRPWWLSPDALTYRVHLALARSATVHTTEDRRRLADVVGLEPTAQIPHFIRPVTTVRRHRARHLLGVPDTTFVVAVLGFVHERKQCDRAIRLLEHLDDTTQLWFVGGSDTGSPYVERLRDLVAELGLADRVRWTGHLTDEDLALNISAVDVGLCLYGDASATGSLATWIGSRTPVVASDLPVMREHAHLAPGAVAVVTGDDEAVSALSSLRSDSPAPEVWDVALHALSVDDLARRYEGHWSAGRPGRGRLAWKAAAAAERAADLLATSRPAGPSLGIVIVGWDPDRTVEVVARALRFARGRGTAETSVVIVANNGRSYGAIKERIDTLTVPAHVEVIHGSNAEAEFSGFDEGVTALRESRGNRLPDAVALLNDRLLSYETGDYLSGLTPDVVEMVVREPVVVGRIDRFPVPMDTWVGHLSTYVRSNYLVCSGHMLDRVSLRPFEPAEFERRLPEHPEGLQRLFDDAFAQPYGSFLAHWLTGPRTDDGKAWYQAEPLTDESWPRLRSKVRSILNEHALSGQFQQLDLTLVPAEVAHRLAPMDERSRRHWIHELRRRATSSLDLVGDASLRRRLATAAVVSSIRQRGGRVPLRGAAGPGHP